MIDDVTKIIRKVLSEERTSLLEPESKEICQLYGIPVPTYEVAKTKEEAVRYSKKIGYPVVLKIVSPNILHKSDVGGVVLNLKTEHEVEKAYEHILENVHQFNPNAKIVGIIVEEMAPPTTELVIGMMKDPTFGPALMFGLGGIFVEILEDVAFRLAPITSGDAEKMIQEIRAYKILEGIRGRDPADKDAIIKVLLKVSKLVTDHPEIEQLDLNPVLVYKTGLKVVDARIIVSGSSAI